MRTQYVRTEQERIDALYGEMLDDVKHYGKGSWYEASAWHIRATVEADCRCTFGAGLACKHGILARMSEKEKLNRS